jgi:hypothetical protein
VEKKPQKCTKTEPERLEWYRLRAVESQRALCENMVWEFLLFSGQEKKDLLTSTRIRCSTLQEA